MKKQTKIRITSALLAVILSGNVLVLTGCKKNTKEDPGYSQSVVLDTETQDEIEDMFYNKSYTIHDFNLLPNNNKSINIEYEDKKNWDNVFDSFIKNDDSFEGWIDFNVNELDYSDYFTYNIGIFDKKNASSISSYYKIINEKGNFVDDYQYDKISFVNPYTSILTRYEMVDDEKKEKNVLINHITGEIKKFNYHIEPANGFVVASNMGYMQLLYSNGNKASNDIYRDILSDEDNGLLYFINSDKTEVMDVNSNKAIYYDCIVENVNRGYFISYVYDNDMTKKYKVMYQENIDTNPIYLFGGRYSNISFANEKSEDSNTFILSNIIDNKSIYKLCSDNGIIISKDYNFIASSVDNSGYNFVVNNDSDNNIKYGIISNYGEEILSPQGYELYTLIGNYVSFKNINKYGLMSINGDIVVSPQYDECINCGSHFEALKKSSNGLVERTIFTPNLHVIKSGIISSTEAKDIYSEWEKNNNNILIKK